MDELPKILTPRTNTGLFSEYYIKEVLLRLTYENSSKFYLPAGTLQAKWDLLTEKLKKVEPYIDKGNEYQTRKDIIEPILEEILGHVFDIEVTDGGNRPDYFLFKTIEDFEKAKEYRDDPEQYKKFAIGLADAKSWKQTAYSKLSSKASIAQIFRYLTDSNKDWGFITNGRLWRLFARKDGIRQDQFIEFNLKDFAKDSVPPVEFRLFYLLFRREAYAQDSDGTSFLDRILAQSIEEAAGIQRDLKEKVYLAFGKVAEEFRRLKKNKVVADTDAARQVLKDNSLVFLYRILFLLYAESKLILPVDDDEKRYDQYSLQKLRNEIELDPRHTLANRTTFWSKLQDLFRIIHGLDEDENRLLENLEIPLPSYNGGLFDPKHWPLLETWELGDKTVSEVMYLLTKTKRQNGGAKNSNAPATANVSYRDLGVQHLGNIYEGILENKLVLEDGKIVVQTDNGERKATGSYYTPDYIVDYIVKETIGPLVADAKTHDDILKVKVLDPAMGSGHFLIGAIDFLADRLAKTKVSYSEEELKDARRVVAERCIYGVDINPMAVELAKLSIWLHTISKEKPLTFLDNHIKCGNSLIGAHIADLHSLPDKKKTLADAESALNLFPDDKLIKEMKLWLGDGKVFTNPSDTIEDVKLKATAEKVLDDRRMKYRHLADLWTSYYFQDVPKSEISILYRKLAEAISVNAKESPLPKSLIMDEALRIAEEKRFFHWEFEFPEIFFDNFGRHKGENGGFDAVIGNPPYVRQETLGETKELYYKHTYQVYSNTADLYVYFYELGKRNLKNWGRLGLITSNKFIKSTYGKPLREFLKNTVALKEIVDFGELRVFDEAATMPVVVVVANGVTKEQSFNFTQVKSLGFENLKTVTDMDSMQLGESALEGENWSLSSQKEVELIAKLRLYSVSLKDYSEVSMRRGILTGFNKAFVIYQSKRDELVRRDPKCAIIIKPYALGDDIRRYHINYEQRYLIWTYVGVPIESYPAIFDHLKQFQPQLEARQDQGEHWWELRACAYYDDFQKPKMVFPDIAKTSRFAFDNDGLFLANTAYLLPIQDFFLLSVLNSRLILQYYKRNSTVLGDADKGGRMRWIYQDVARIPIRTISFTTPKKAREKLTRQLIALSEKAIGGISENDSDDAILEKLSAVIELAKKYAEDKNDVLHDFLAHLAEEMISMNKEKQSAAEKFFEWMTNHDIKARSEMNPKTYLDEYWNLDMKDFNKYLTKNKVTLPKITRDYLEEEFPASKKNLMLISSKIKHTDWLIDQVVYALYGLTEDEIHVVEGG